MEELINRIFNINTEYEFNVCALDVYAFQSKNIPVYSQYISHLRKPAPKHYSEIPHLPIGFFKSHDILAEGKSPAATFLSSGTTGMQRSKHLVADVSLYERSFLPTYERFLGKLEDQIIFALLPSYVSQGDSSLVYMVHALIAATHHPISGFYLEELDELINAISSARGSGKKLVLFGVSYALLDLAELQPDLSDVLVIETGGMEGRRKEMSKEEMHHTLKMAFGCEYIASEYGMCELLSQAYSNANGLFELPNWMRVQLREVNDPFQYLSIDKTGGVNVIDLANLYSCAFIETQDLGRIENGLLRLMGRFDNSDIRGCNLLVQ